MLKFKAITFERYSGHYGIGETPKAAWESLLRALKDDGTVWSNVTSFVLVSWQTDGALPPDEQTLIGFGSLRVTPKVTVRGKRRIELAVAINKLDREQRASRLGLVRT